MIKTVKKWTIAAATMAALSVGGYSVVDWDDVQGYIVSDGIDTLSFADSTGLADFGKLNELRLK